MIGHHHKRFVRWLLAWVAAGLLLLPFSAMSGMYCGDDPDHEPGVHCQHDGSQAVSADTADAADVEADCCCDDLFHVLGCQHHCQTAGHASLIARMAGGTIAADHVWTGFEARPWQGIPAAPPYHPPRS